MSVRGINHVGISCVDLERSMRFYRDLLGFREVLGETSIAEIDNADAISGLRDPSGRFALLAAPNLYIELFQFDSPDPGPPNHEAPVSRCGISHIAMEVEEIEVVHGRLVEAGVPFHTLPVDPGDGSLATYGRDPDGNVFELVELRTRGPSSALSLDQLAGADTNERSAQ